MKKVFYCTICYLMFACGCNPKPQSVSERSFAIIPAPASITEIKGNFNFSEKTRIIIPPANSDIKLAADFLALLLNNSTSWNIKVEEGIKQTRNSVYMTLDTSVINDEGYILKITSGKIIVRAKSPAGLFYAVQTLRQMLPAEVENQSVKEVLTLSVPACEIKDEPRFVYRGMHLDVARHMIPVSYIKRYIDMMALHKMNTFHWHLTDDQGWRIEIRKYPRLTGVGAFRKETLVGHARNKPYVFDGQPYGGFYTRDEVKEIVDYAKSRFVTIVPEIEMPGHAMAALASYPELSCKGGPFEVIPWWGVTDDVFCAGKEKTFAFLGDVLDEVSELFPGQYIHIGGDECPKTRWERCPACQARIKAEGLKDENELQSYFIQRIEKLLASKGRRLIGWDEILDGGLAHDATVMSWRGIERGIAAARQEHNVVMTPSRYMYLNYYQCEPEGQPLAAGGYLPLERVYSYNPLPSELIPEEQKYILGVQGNLWTEYITTPAYMEYMAYPRMFAVAEIGWTPEMLKDFEDFLARLEILKNRYDIMGINYFRGEYRDIRAGALEK